MVKRILKGKVVSDKSNKTIVVEVSRRFVHPKYKKVMTTYKKYHAHDEKINLKLEIQFLLLRANQFQSLSAGQLLEAINK